MCTIVIRQLNRFSLSEFFYAFDLDNIRLQFNDGPNPYTWVIIPSIWFKRKNRVDTVMKGTVSDLVQGEVTDPREGFSRLTERMDGRYGGHTHFRWDGTQM